MDPVKLNISDLQITVRCTAGFDPHAQPNIVYLPVVQGDGQDVWDCCKGLASRDFALACISGLDWDNALSPWKCEGVFAGDEPFRGDAGATLRLLVDEVVPAVERELSVEHPVRTIAGYSLGGLFALWSLCKCPTFQNAVSASGSLWVPGFIEYLAGHDFLQRPSRVYLSLGKKETRTPSRLLRNVANATQDAYEILCARGIESVFEWNPGNHFSEPALRTARGITWVLR